MSDRDNRLVDLAAALSDGTPIDWDTAESSAATDSERAQIRRMRLVHQVAQGQSSDSTASRGDSGGVHESLLHPSNEASGHSSDDTALIAWGPLRVIEKIGRGRFGDVYRAWDPRLDRDVALKLLRRRESGGDVASLVIEEGRLLAKVRHPNVVPVYGAERIDDRVGVWMELIHGRTLEDELVAGGPMAAADVTSIGIDICRALGAVHRAGLVHRDVKAQNVMRDEDGRLVLMDFGTGRELEAASPPELAGTPLYLAPEVLHGGVATPQSDLYSLGVLVYHLATGLFPVTGKTLREIREAHAKQQDAIATSRPGGTIPSALTTVVSRALAKDPSDRFADAASFAAALERSRPMMAVRGRRSAIDWILAVTAIGIAAIGGASLLRSSRAGANPVLGDSSTSTAARRILVSASFAANSISADGRFAVGVDRPPDTGSVDLSVRDLRDGTASVLVGGTPSLYPADPVFSPDGRYIAYRRVHRLPNNADFSPSDIILLETGAGARTRTLASAEPDRFVAPVAWSADARSLLVTVRRPGTLAEPYRTSLGWMSVETGDLRVIKTLEPGQPGNRRLGPRLSPDGRFVAYADRLRPDSGDLHIFLLDVDGRHTSDVVKLAGSHSAPFWSTDGTHLYFISDRSGVRGLWSVAVANGDASGEPLLVHAGFAGEPFALLGTGQLFYELRPSEGGHFEFVAERTGPTARIVQAFMGRAGRWSPDGTKIAYYRVGDGKNDLVVRNTGTGEERLFQTNSPGAAMPQWISDAELLVYIPAVRGDAGGGVLARGAFHGLNLTSGVLTRRFAKDTSQHVRSQITAFSRRDRLLFTGVRDRTGTRWEGIVAVDTTTGAERPVITFPGGGFELGTKQLGLALSPDGQTLAVMAWADVAARKAQLLTVRIDGMGYQKLYGPFPAQGTADLFAWTPDSQSLLFVTTDSDGAWRVLRIAATGGAPAFDGLDSTRLSGPVSFPPLQRGEPWTMDLSPDGLKILFGSPTQPTRELWVIGSGFSAR